MRAGMIPHLKVAKHMYQIAYNKLSHDERLEEVFCACEGGQPGVQDVSHVFWDCAITMEPLEELAKDILIAAENMSLEYAAGLAGMTTQERVLAMLHMTYKGKLGKGADRMSRLWGEAVQRYLEKTGALLCLQKV